MVFSKKLTLKLISVIFGFVMFFVIAEAVFINYINNKNLTVICENQKNHIVNNLLKNIEVLEALTSNIANNEEIISILNENNSLEEIKKNYNDDLIEKSIDLESSINLIEYIDNIEVISLKGKYSFSNYYIRKFEDLDSYWWYDKDDIFPKESKVTEIYKDTLNNKNIISIVSYIQSKENIEVLGAVRLDIDLEKLLSIIEESFKLGRLQIYIELDNEEYYSLQGNVLKNQFNNKDNYISSDDNIVLGEKEIIFAFDKNSLYNKKIFTWLNIFKIVFLLIVGFICTVSLMKIIQIYFKPIMESVHKFKNILEKVDKSNIDFETEDELTQLEAIADLLSKSFDKKIQSLIYYDELTKLPNNKMLFSICNELIKGNEKFALIYLNLNKFKYVNDVFGHLAGDELLYNFGERMRKIIGDRGVVTRYSGDEFIIIYKNYIDDKEILEFYNEIILKEFKRPILFNNNNKIIIEFSAGIAVYPRDGEDVSGLINKSDLMMHNSKEIFNKNNRNEVVLFNDEIYDKIIKAEKLKEELKKAIDKNELILYYQPLVNDKCEIKKVEALIRWNSDKLGFVSPIDFIGYAEETGEIVKIGYWIIEEVCKNFHVFYNGGNVIQVSINVSPIQLMEYDFVENIINIIDKYCIDYNSLCLEITESVVLDKNIIAYENLDKLNKIGIKIALDDFGTGYSSFSYLKKFKLDVLKLDKIFIDNDNDIDYKIVNNIKEIAQLLNMEIVVEGVENKEQFNKLKEIGCQLFQGYYFSKPLPLLELQKFIEKN